MMTHPMSSMIPGNMEELVDELVKIAAEIDDVPTLDQIDAMMAELASRPKSHANGALMDDLLELRALAA